MTHGSVLAGGTPQLEDRITYSCRDTVNSAVRKRNRKQQR